MTITVPPPQDSLLDATPVRDLHQSTDHLLGPDLPPSLGAPDNPPGSVEREDRVGVMLSLRDAAQRERTAQIDQATAIWEAARLWSWCDNFETCLEEMHGGPDDPARRFGERMWQPGGDGTPEVAEFLKLEVGPALGVSPESAATLIRDVLDLVYRHPRMWELVTAGLIPVWVARKVTGMTHRAKLPLAICHELDRRLSRFAPAWTATRIFNTTAELIVHLDPLGAEERRRAALARRYADIVRPFDNEGGGILRMYAQLDAGPALVLDDTLNTLADVLIAAYPDAGHDERRARALECLSDPSLVIELLDGDLTRLTTNNAEPRKSDPSEPDPDPTEPAPDPTEPASDPSEPDPDPTEPDPEPAEPEPGRCVDDDSTPPNTSPAARRSGLAEVAILAGACPGAITASPAQSASPTHAPNSAEAPNPAQTANPGSQADSPFAAARRPLQQPKKGREVVLMLHINHGDLVAGAGGSGPDLGPIVRSQLDALLHDAAKVTVKPIIDPWATSVTDAYRPPAAMDERVRLRNPVVVYPYSNRSSAAQRIDIDHTVPWPEGRTTETNLGPLDRTSHRANTHGGFTLKQEHPGVFRWTTPAGQTFWVTPLGTFSQDPGIHHYPRSVQLRILHGAWPSPADRPTAPDQRDPKHGRGGAPQPPQNGSFATSGQNSGTSGEDDDPHYDDPLGPTPQPPTF